MLRGNIISLRHLNLNDVYSFVNWAKHPSVLLWDYNFYAKTDREIIEWYKWKTRNPSSHYFAVLKDNVPIGYISLKSINNIFKRASIGIVLNPSLVNHGYGEDALKTILKYSFRDLNLNKVHLKVASYNKRALHLYKKLGFTIIRKNLMAFPNGDFDEKNMDFLRERDNFKIIFGKTYFYAYKMELKKEDFHYEL
ncbi:GNAT family N-acetyltransferase [uncultured Peptoniphilus sp.]|uniref:GNAT family N-acetyltransferase n=1 Tax=uncultured Peptoniphilus sp. TaxID=254354 RepID=UPI002805C6B4|nr:GNAT family N-acetyltransferase [uncultured Peptoniphilus sp.]